MNRRFPPLFALLLICSAANTYGNPRPSPGQSSITFSGCGIALVLETIVVIALLRRFSPKRFRFGAAYLAVTLFTFWGFFLSGLMDLFPGSWPEIWVLAAVESTIALLEAACIFGLLARFSSLWESKLRPGFGISLFASVIGNLVSLTSGIFIIRTGIWFWWTWALGPNGPQGSYLRFLSPF